ncbi:hypothetical protein L209DRAFT_57728 [Thermothelomyces heterothallicus CBS 203.75]
MFRGTAHKIKGRRAFMTSRCIYSYIASLYQPLLELINWLVVVGIHGGTYDCHNFDANATKGDRVSGRLNVT